MPFGMVNEVGRGMGVLDGDGDGNRRREGAFLLMSLGRPIMGTLLRSCARATRCSQISLRGLVWSVCNNNNTCLLYTSDAADE